MVSNSLQEHNATHLPLSFFEALVDRIVEDVHNSHYNVMNGRLMSGQIGPKPDELKELGTRRLLCDLLPARPATVLYDKGLGKDQSVRVTQLSVVRQASKSGECGYHALHNLAVLARVICTNSAGDADSMLQYLTSHASYQRTFRYLTSLLSEEQLMYGDSVTSGILERPHLQHLSVQPELRWLLGEKCTVVLELGMSSWKMNRPPLSIIHTLNRVTQNFADPTSGDQHHIFVVGVLIHWVGILVNKVGGKIEICFVDSYNKTTPWIEDTSKLEQECQDMDFGTWPLPVDLLQSLYLQGILGIQYFVHLLADAVSGEASMGQSIVALVVDHFLESFSETFPEISYHRGVTGKARTSKNPNTAGDQPTALRDRVLVWLMESYPPAIIDTNIIAVLKDRQGDLLTSEMVRHLRLWVQSARDLVEMCSDDQELTEILTRFSHTINVMEGCLEATQSTM